MFKFKVDYNKKIKKRREKIIRKDVKKFKRLCIEDFNWYIRRGERVSYTDCFLNVNRNFEEEIAERVVEQIKKENPDLEVEIVFRHFQNSYRCIKISV